MSFGVIQYKSPFRPVLRNLDHVCGFCGTKVDVKYAYDVESSVGYPEPARCDATSVYSCSSCTLKRMYSIPDQEFKYEFDLSDPYKYMSTLQRMYADVEKAKNRFHKKWAYCYGCHKYVPVENGVQEASEEGTSVLKCSDCGEILRCLDKEE